MPASKQAKPSSFADLTVQVVRASAQPIPFDEILRRVNAMRRIDTNSPKGTIRSAIAQCRLIGPDGRGNYGWTPRMMRGARVRVRLVDADPKHKPPRIEIDDDARELLWPGFFAHGKLRDHDPIDLMLPDGDVTRLPLDFFGHGHWGTEGSPELWRWLKSVKARAGDDLIFEAVDAEARRYRVEHVPGAQRDDAAVRVRTIETIEAGVQLLRSSRGKSVSSKWDMARMLLVMGHYTHPVPPKQMSDVWQVMLRRDEGAPAPSERIYQLKISLEEARPAIWRRVLVPAEWSLGALHYVIQVTMGWANSHLHHFIFGDDAQRKYYSLYVHEDDDLRTLDATRVKLSDVFPKVGTGCTYEYDFGDSWVHRIELEAIVQADASQAYPWCVTGERAGPPDDCGGVPGYEGLLEILRDRGHPEHEDMRSWVEDIKGHDFDPARFDIEWVNRRLGWINPKQLSAERNVRLFVGWR